MIAVEEEAEEEERGSGIAIEGTGSTETGSLSEEVVDSLADMRVTTGGTESSSVACNKSRLLACARASTNETRFA